MEEHPERIDSDGLHPDSIAAVRAMGTVDIVLGSSILALAGSGMIVLGAEALAQKDAGQALLFGGGAVIAGLCTHAGRKILRHGIDFTREAQTNAAVNRIAEQEDL